MTATLADVTEALELYGQHHPECAALWAGKTCDCGLSMFVDKSVPALEMHRPNPELEELAVRPFGGEERGGRPRVAGAERPGFDRGTLYRDCDGCGERFGQPRRSGRPRGKCGACRA